MKQRSQVLATLLALAASSFSFAQTPPTGIKVKVFADTAITIRFDEHLRDWDGFGFNYVQTAQTRDHDVWPQEYGGFSVLSEQERDEVLDLVFGEDGLRPALTKLFLDPWHEGKTKAGNDNADPWKLNPAGYDHQTTSRWMLYFNREGLRRVREWGGELTMMTTLYSPAPWMTKQKFVLGRDIDPAERLEIAEYMAAWVKHLREDQRLPVRYLSFHNEGCAYYRWPRDASNPGEDHRDYNAWWRPEDVVEFLKITRQMLDHNGLQEIQLTPGETQTWSRFDDWGYAAAIARSSGALRYLGLITSHSFAVTQLMQSVYYGDWRSNGTDLLRSKRPELHAWVTSMSWKKMDAQFVDNIRRTIYMSKVNGFIPWAGIQRRSQWLGGDPNPDSAIHVTEDGNYRVLPGYYFYKQVSRAGQPGMAVSAVTSLDPAVSVIAFANNGTKHPDAFVLVNTSGTAKEAAITIHGASTQSFRVFRTSAGENYASLGGAQLTGGNLTYALPAGSVTTFFGK